MIHGPPQILHEMALGMSSSTWQPLLDFYVTVRLESFSRYTAESSVAVTQTESQHLCWRRQEVCTSSRIQPACRTCSMPARPAMNLSTCMFQHMRDIAYRHRIHDRCRAKVSTDDTCCLTGLSKVSLGALLRRNECNRVLIEV